MFLDLCEIICLNFVPWWIWITKIPHDLGWSVLLFPSIVCASQIHPWNLTLSTPLKFDAKQREILGGGNRNICFDFYPDPWGNDDPIWGSYVSDGWEISPPTIVVLKKWHVFSRSYSGNLFILYLFFKHVWNTLVPMNGWNSHGPHEK